MLAALCYSIFEKQYSNIYHVDSPLWICLYRQSGNFTPQEAMSDIRFQVDQGVSLSQSSYYVLNGTKEHFAVSVQNNQEICAGLSGQLVYNVYIFEAKNRVCLYTCYGNDKPRIIRYDVTLANQTQNSFFVVYDEVVMDRTESQRYLLNATCRIETPAIVTSGVNVIMYARDVYGSYIVTQNAFLLLHDATATNNKANLNITRYLLEEEKCRDMQKRYSNVTGMCEDFVELVPVSALSHLHQVLVTIPPNGIAAQLCFEQTVSNCDNHVDAIMQECEHNADICSSEQVDTVWSSRHNGRLYFDCSPDRDGNPPTHLMSKTYCVTPTDRMIMFKNSVVSVYSVCIVIFVLVFAYSVAFVCRFKIVSMIKKRQSLYFLMFFQQVEASIYNAKKHQEASFWYENELGMDDGYDDVYFEQTADQEAAESSVFANGINRDYDIFVQISWLFAYPRRDEQDYQPEQYKEEVFQLKAYVREQQQKLEGPRSRQLNCIFDININQEYEQYILMEGDDTDQAQQPQAGSAFNQQKLMIKDTSSVSEDDTKLVCKVNRVAEKSESEFDYIITGRLINHSSDDESSSEKDLHKSRSTRSNASSIK